MLHQELERVGPDLGIFIQVSEPNIHKYICSRKNSPQMSRYDLRLFLCSLVDPDELR